MKLTGYIIAIIGIVAIASSVIKEVQDFIFTKILNITYSSLYENYLFYGGIILAIIGIYIVMKFSKRRSKIKSGEEIPIYHKNKIVGYRRH